MKNDAKLLADRELTGKVKRYRIAKSTTNGLNRWLVIFAVNDGTEETIGLLSDPKDLHGEVTVVGRHAVIDDKPLYTEEGKPIFNWTAWQTSADAVFENKCAIAAKYNLALAGL
jgi:hypothetical protein